MSTFNKKANSNKVVVCYLLSVSLLLITINAAGQDTTSHSLPASRNDIENHRMPGFVISTEKGIELRIGGFVQADFMHDLKETSNLDAFQPSTITVPTYNNGTTNFSIRQSRLNFSAKGPTTSQGDLFALVELDLWGADGSVTPRLRHAWISLGKWGAGQYWSNFTDNETWPNLIDFWGPNAAIWKRQIQLRFTQPVSKSSTLSFSVEQPSMDITFPTDSTTWSERPMYPDITAAYKFSWDGDNSHLRLSGLFHPITYRTTSNSAVNIFGGALNLSGNIRTTGRNALKFQMSYGSGYARYNEDIGGQGYEAMADPYKNYELKTVTQRYLWMFYDHWWSKKWSSTIGWGNVTIDSEEYFPQSSISYTNYGVANLLWYPNNYFKTGIEMLYGNRKNLNGEKGENIRIQLSAFVKL